MSELNPSRVDELELKVAREGWYGVGSALHVEYRNLARELERELEVLAKVTTERDILRSASNTALTYLDQPGVRPGGKRYAAVKQLRAALKESKW